MLEAQTQAVRNAGRVGDRVSAAKRPLTANQSDVTANEFSIDDVRGVPGAVPPNTEFSVTVEYSASGFQGDPSLWNSDHPDHCTVDRFGIVPQPGAKMFIRVTSAVTSTSEWDCWLVQNDTPITPTLRAVSASSGGPQEITVELVGYESETVYESTTIEINVDDTADEPEDPPDERDDPDPDDPTNGGDSYGWDDLPLPEIGTGQAYLYGGVTGLVLLLILLLKP